MSPSYSLYDPKQEMSVQGMTNTVYQNLCNFLFYVNILCNLNPKRLLSSPPKIVYTWDIFEHHLDDISYRRVISSSTYFGTTEFRDRDVMSYGTYDHQFNYFPYSTNICCVRIKYLLS